MKADLGGALTGARTSWEVGQAWAQDVLRALNAGVIVFSGSGEILFGNPRARVVLHRKWDNLVGANVSDVLVSVEDLVAGANEERIEFDIRLPGGELIAIGASITALGVDESADLGSLPPQSERTYACMFQDITQLRQIQVERDRLLQVGALNAALPSVLHELRNPVAAIATSLEVLVEESEGDLQNDLHALLTEIRRVSLNLQGVGSVVRDLRSSRFAAVDECLHNLLRVMEAQAEAKAVTLVDEIDTMPLLPLDVSVVQAIAFNLIHNAIAASNEGGAVKVKACLDSGRSFYLVVTDAGAGMSEEVMQRATSLFFTTKSRGSGLGLALVKRCVETANGQLRFFSELGKGTEATVIIPEATSPPGKTVARA